MSVRGGPGTCVIIETVGFRCRVAGKTLRSSRPLRTLRARFPTYGSSISKPVGRPPRGPECASKRRRLGPRSFPSSNPKYQVVATIANLLAASLPHITLVECVSNAGCAPPQPKIKDISKTYAASGPRAQRPVAPVEAHWKQVDPDVISPVAIAAKRVPVVRPALPPFWERLFTAP